MDENKYKEWEKVNKKLHDEHVKFVKELRKNKSISKQHRDEQIEMEYKKYTQKFFEVRMQYLGH